MDKISENVKGAADAAQSTMEEKTSKVNDGAAKMSENVKESTDAAHSTAMDEKAKLEDEANKMSENTKEEASKFNTGNLAGAAGDMLKSASDYANLKDTSAGQYVEKAENYLKGYKDGNTK